MRWLWRLLILLLVIGLLKSMWAPQPQTFIALPASTGWADRIQREVQQWQRLLQDLPSSIETEIRQLWREFQPDGTGETV